MNHLIFLSLHLSFHSLCFSLTLLLISSIYHPIFLCVARPFSNLEVLPVDSNKNIFQNLLVGFNKSIFLATLPLLVDIRVEVAALSSCILHISPGYKFSFGISNFSYHKKCTSSFSLLINSSLCLTLDILKMYFDLFSPNNNLPLLLIVHTHRSGWLTLF